MVIGVINFVICVPASSVRFLCEAQVCVNLSLKSIEQSQGHKADCSLFFLELKWGWKNRMSCIVSDPQGGLLIYFIVAGVVRAVKWFGA